MGYDLSFTGIIISVLFSTTLAPIAGNYGPVAGFLAGVFHMILVTNVGIIHGRINLYNNGVFTLYYGSITGLPEICNRYKI
ncbi:DUF1576 domain-containing protein [Anaerocolumna cellulosilytica]|uniref:DUF1576 domain-containing protein n=1 Tax=Anaerocolumna cellulosilytica TaxID=433286 RepID=UPI001629EA4C